MTDFAAARRKMVDNQLRTSNVTDWRILAAMDEVPRERFVPADRQGLAYADVVHALGNGHVLAAPAAFAKLIQLASIEHSDHVLDVGAGSGYSSAVLARLAAEVTALETDAALVAAAREKLAEVGASGVTVVHAGLDGATLPAGHYDVIIVEGALDSIPEHLFNLLRDGGRLVAPIGRGGAASAHVFVRSGSDVASRTEFNTNLPPLSRSAEPETFVF